MKKIIIILYALCILLPAFSQPCYTDNGFGTNGRVVTNFNGYDDFVSGIAIQPDGKFVVAGECYDGIDWSFALMRYNTDGTIDNTFGNSGKVKTIFNSAIAFATAIVLQPDGKIVAVGGASNGTNFDFTMARYNSDGSLDNTFGTSGKVRTPFGSGDDAAYAVALQGDNKIVVAGYMYNGNDYDFALIRYETDGSLDNSFGTGGMLNMDFGALQLTNDDYARAIVIQPDGRILVAGYSDNGTNNNDFALTRLDANGNVDNTFGVNGIVLTDYLGATDDYAYDMALQTDGKIVVVGKVTYGQENAVVVRYTPNGVVDNTFGSSGKVMIGFGQNGERASAVLIHPNGKIIVAGSYSNGSNADFALAQLNTDGSFDAACSNDGKVTTPIGSGDENALALALQADGKVILAGFSDYAANNNPDFAIVRYNSSGAVGFEDVYNDQAISIYPNPATNKLHIAVQDNLEISVLVYNNTGQVVLESQIAAGMELDIHLLPMGAYTAEVHKTDAVIRKRFIKM